MVPFAPEIRADRLLVHIYFLVGFKNRSFVVLQWAWAYLRFHRGARLSVGKDWRFNAGQD